MGKPRTMSLRFPGMGVVRSQSHERQYSAVDYPTPWSMNCRLEDDLTERLRGGSFVGISAGSRPSSIVYRDRTLTFSGRVVTASRVGDSTDTDLDSDVSDMLRATLFQFAEADDQGSTVVALVPHKDTHLVGFTATETWVQQGDPLGGSRRRISDQVGAVSENAWCVAHDTVFFLSARGLYSVSADGSGLKAISEDALPEDLIGVSTATLTYQHASRGVFIHVTGGTNWFYDIERGGFWPFDTSTTNSHVLVGPLRLGDAISYGMLQQITGVTAANSATVNWRVVPGKTAEEACDNGKLAITAALAGTNYGHYISSDGSWTAGRSSVGWPRARSMWCCLWLSSSSSWAFEAIHLVVTPFGRWRG